MKKNDKIIALAFSVAFAFGVLTWTSLAFTEEISVEVPIQYALESVESNKAMLSILEEVIYTFKFLQENGDIKGLFVNGDSPIAIEISEQESGEIEYIKLIWEKPKPKVLEAETPEVVTPEADILEADTPEMDKPMVISDCGMRIADCGMKTLNPFDCGVRNQ